MCQHRVFLLSVGAIADVQGHDVASLDSPHICYPPVGEARGRGTGTAAACHVLEYKTNNILDSEFR